MREVASGVFMVTHAHTNCYLVVDAGEVTIVDAGYPSTWELVRVTLEAIGLRVTDVAAVLLTHGHFDHVGFARFVQSRFAVPVLVHEADRWLAAHPYRYRPQRNRLLFPLKHPASIPVLSRMVSAGALRVRGVDATTTFEEGPLDLPGSPVAIPTPGHTDGHCAFHLPGRGVLLTGDALVTLDPYTGRRGPRMVAPAATADLDLNRRSLVRLGALEAKLLLPGHGDPWPNGGASAVRIALHARYG